MRLSYILSPLLASCLSAASLIQRRDTCAQVNTDLNVLGVALGAINICLCISGIDLFIALHLDATLVGQAGKANVEAELSALINDGPGCYSSRKRSPAEIARSQHKCEFGLSKCGIWTGAPSPSHTFPPNVATNTQSDYARVGAYECLDTMTDLESCGGCVEQYTLGLTEDEIAALQVGVDCTADPSVSSVECRKGHCVVHACKKGYTLVPKQGQVDGLFECVRKASGELHEQVGGTLEWKKAI